MSGTPFNQTNYFRRGKKRGSLDLERDHCGINAQGVYLPVVLLEDLINKLLQAIVKRTYQNLALSFGTKEEMVRQPIHCAWILIIIHVATIHKNDSSYKGCSNGGLMERRLQENCKIAATRSRYVLGKAWCSVKHWMLVDNTVMVIP